MNQALNHRFAGILLAAMIAAAPSVATGQSDQRHGSPLFENYTEQAGIRHRGQTWGASWRDFDNDGKPDFVVSNHFTGPGYQGPMASLFHNLGDGRFADVAESLLGSFQRDLHGGSWADFDNDGDADLIFSAGGDSGLAKAGQLDGRGMSSTANLFLVQEQGTFTEQAALYGLTLPTQRGRRATWHDVDRDGLLDIFLAQATPDGPSSVLYLQRPHGFISCLEAVPGLTSRDDSRLFLLFPGFQDDGRYLLMHGSETPGKLFRYRGGAKKCEFEAIPNKHTSHVRGTPDFVLADLTGDLSLDYFAPTQAYPPFERHSNPRHVVLGLPGTQPLTEILFRTTGPVRIVVRPAVGARGWTRPDSPLIFLGPEGRHPQRYQFTLDPANTSLHGPLNLDPFPTGLFIHFDPNTHKWYLRIKKETWRNITIELTSKTPIERLSPPLTNATSREQPSVFLIQGDTEWEDHLAAAGLAQLKVSCRTAVSGDFDNDMDVDLYVGCSDDRGSHRNIYLENRQGKLIENPEVGAQGQTQGILDSVTTADFDNNGFLDLLITYGAGDGREVHGPLMLYRNIGNNNNWIKLRLVATTDNRDAYGARVFLTAGGITQMRYLSGGFHTTGQDDSILSFGLGNNTTVEQLIVEWPNRTLEQFDVRTVNGTLTLNQGGGRRLTEPTILVANHMIPQGTQVRFLLLTPWPVTRQEVVWKLGENRQLSGQVAIRHRFSVPGPHRIHAEFSGPGSTWNTTETLVNVYAPAGH